MKPIISKNLTPLPPFPTLAQRAEGWEGGFQSLSPLRGEVWRGVNLYLENFSNILLRPLVWMGDSCKNIREFPEEVKKAVGYALQLVQAGETPLTAKPFKQRYKDAQAREQ